MCHFTVEQLRSNLLLHAVIDATVQPRFGGLTSVECDGDNWYLDDSQGTAGEIRFLPDGVVGAFCAYDCRYQRSWLARNQDYFYRGIPPGLRDSAEEIVRTHPHICVPVGDEEMSLATAVLWSEGGRLAAAVPWPEFMENSGYILRRHLLPPEEALRTWAQSYGLTDAEAEFAQRVFERKVAAQGASIELSEGEARWIEEQARSLRELRSCLHYFSGIGVYIPVNWERVNLAEPGRAAEPPRE